MKKDPEDRLTMTEILEHSWVKKDYRSASSLLPEFTSSRPETSISLETSDESKSPKASPTAAVFHNSSNAVLSLNATAPSKVLSSNNIAYKSSLPNTVIPTKTLNKTASSKVLSNICSDSKEYCSPTITKSGHSCKLYRRCPEETNFRRALFNDYFFGLPMPPVVNFTPTSPFMSERYPGLPSLIACGLMENDTNDYSSWPTSALLKTPPPPCVVRS